jgi:hypothetical protein
MEGTNFVELKGKVIYPSFKTVGSGHRLFKGKLAIPIKGDANNNRFQYIKIAAWNELAELMNNLPQDAFVKVHGHIEERSYDGKCKQCGAAEKKYWTEVLVDNFVAVKEE